MRLDGSAGSAMYMRCMAAVFDCERRREWCAVRRLRSGVLESFVNFEMGIFADHRDLAPWRHILAPLW
jgi:hypothetical protein